MEYFVMACVCVVVWSLMCYNAREDERWMREFGGICEGCNGDCRRDERLCEHCRKTKRAAEIKRELSKENGND